MSLLDSVFGLADTLKNFDKNKLEEEAKKWNVCPVCNIPIRSTLCPICGLGTNPIEKEKPSELIQEPKKGSVRQPEPKEKPTELVNFWEIADGIFGKPKE